MDSCRDEVCSEYMPTCEETSVSLEYVFKMQVTAIHAYLLLVPKVVPEWILQPYFGTGTGKFSTFAQWRNPVHRLLPPLENNKSGSISQVLGFLKVLNNNFTKGDFGSVQKGNIQRPLPSLGYNLLQLFFWRSTCRAKRGWIEHVDNVFSQVRTRIFESSISVSNFSGFNNRYLDLGAS